MNCAANYRLTIFKRIAKIKFVMFFIAYPIILLTA